MRCRGCFRCASRTPMPVVVRAAGRAGAPLRGRWSIRAPRRAQCPHRAVATNYASHKQSTVWKTGRRGLRPLRWCVQAWWLRAAGCRPYRGWWLAAIAVHNCHGGTRRGASPTRSIATIRAAERRKPPDYTNYTKPVLPVSNPGLSYIPVRTNIFNISSEWDGVR